jgi:hypothetical protein
MNFSPTSRRPTTGRRVSGSGARTAMGWTVSVDEMRTMADDSYAVGATPVDVTGIDGFQGREIAAVPVAELPANEAARRSLVGPGRASDPRATDAWSGGRLGSAPDVSLSRRR